MEKRAHKSFWPRIILVGVTLVLLLAIVLVTVITTHKPKAIWRLVASVYEKPPDPSSIAGGFTTLPPATTLPTDKECAARVHRSSWEPRTDNKVANQKIPSDVQLSLLAPWDEKIGLDSQANTLLLRVTGNFTGTTDEIIQWGACKWGLDENLVRAEAVVETIWNQGYHGDYTNDKGYCPPDTWDGKGCYQSYGLFQIKYASFPSAWPMSRDDTAFNIDYTLGVIRTCFEGWTTYLNERTPLPGYQHYHSGDIWGCLGRWFSGGWYDQGAVDYIQKVKSTLDDKTWLQPGF